MALLSTACYKKEMKKIAALLYGRDDGHLDHLAPICSLLDIPLYITSNTLYCFALEQYKDITCILANPNDVAAIITENYEGILSTLPRQLLDPIFLFEEITFKKRLHSYWLPHGASDKNNMSALTNEDTLLIYGDKMKLMLPQEEQEKTISIGNFRLQYFIKYKAFYHTLLKNHFRFDRTNILYAPSWEFDISSMIDRLIAQKPKNTTLFIKPHPNSYKKGTLTATMIRYEGIEGIFFIENFFPIYPLLSMMDALYTDISSIGYDFLFFDKPLFFTEDITSPLNACGSLVDWNSPYKILPSDLHHEQRAALYANVFSKKSNLENM